MTAKIPKDNWYILLLDYLANSYKPALAAGFLVGSGITYAIIILFPSIYNSKDIDPGIFLLLTFFLPFAIIAIVIMMWSRRWKKYRAEKQVLQQK